MKPPAPIQKPAVKTNVGPNLKLIRNLFIIGGLLIAIFIVWEIRRETRIKRERQISEAIERKKEAREKALADAREKAEAEARKRQAELAALKIKRETAENTEPISPVKVAPETTGNRITTPEKTPEPELPPEIASLITKGRDLVISAGRKRDEQLAENAKKLTWDLDAHVRSLSKSEQIHGINNVNRIKNLIENNRVPDSILQSDEVEFTRKMEDIATFAVTKQKQIDQAFIGEAAKIQGAYIRKLGEAIKKAEDAGQKPLAASLARRLKEASSLEAWLRSLGVDETATN
jgi:hypothetical protein